MTVEADLIRREAIDADMLNFGRMTMDGIPYSDLAEYEAGEVDWFDFWATKGDYYEEIGQAAIDAGATLTGGELLWLASLNYQYAQYLWFHDLEQRQHGQRRKVELYARAAPYLSPPAERVEVAIDQTKMVGYLRLPQGARGPVPCSVLLGGMESTKEESYKFENLLLERGIATFAFDGPGQGELHPEVPMSGDFQRYSSAAVDWLVERPELDPGAIGVAGRSLGGHYALRSAACEERFRACVSWGGPYSFSADGWEAMNSRYRTGFSYLTKQPIEDAGTYLAEALDLDPVIEGLTCPTLITDGLASWAWIPNAMIANLNEKVPDAPIEWDLYDRGDHCAHNMGPVPRLRAADFLQRILGATPAASS